jgi:hypothetical protein
LDEAAAAAGGAEDVDGGQVFKHGIVYRGVYCPSLSNSFREDHLELAYQRYSHRQRQKSLIIVNLVDALLKIVLATVTHYIHTLCFLGGTNRMFKCLMAHIVTMHM